MRAIRRDDGTHNERLPCHEETLSRKLEISYNDHQPEKSSRNMATIPGQIKPPSPDIGQKRRRVDIHHAQEHTHAAPGSAKIVQKLAEILSDKRYEL